MEIEAEEAQDEALKLRSNDLRKMMGKESLNDGQTSCGYNRQVAMAGSDRDHEEVRREAKRDDRRRLGTEVTGHGRCASGHGEAVGGIGKRAAEWVSRATAGAEETGRPGDGKQSWKWNGESKVKPEADGKWTGQFSLTGQVSKRATGGEVSSRDGRKRRPGELGGRWNLPEGSDLERSRDGWGRGKKPTPSLLWKKSLRIG